MNFKESLDAYRRREATPEQARMVEEEIEKNKLINDYICGEMELTPPAPGPDTAGKPDKESYKAVKKIMRRTLWKVGAIAAAIVLGGLLIANYVVSPLIASQHYDPTKVIEKGKNNAAPITQGELDTRASFELTVYSDDLAGYYARDLGYGKYTVHLFTRDLFTSEYKSQDRMLPMLLTEQTIYFIENGFAFSASGGSSRFGRTYFTGPDRIHNIAGETIVEAAVLFPQDLDMDQLVSIRDHNSDLYFTWAAVKNTSHMPTAHGTEPNIGNMGFHPISLRNGITTPPSIEEKYPNIFLTSGYTPTADELTKHFMSLLTYTCDRDDENIQAYHYSRGSLEYSTTAWHKNTLNLIQQKGIRIYGAVVIGKYEDVVSLYENGVIDGIQIYDTRSSVYQNERY